MKTPAEEERLEPIDELMEDFLQHMRCGQLMSVEELCRENPVLIETLEQLLPVLQWMEEAADRPLQSAESPHFPRKRGTRSV